MRAERVFLNSRKRRDVRPGIWPGFSPLFTFTPHSDPNGSCSHTDLNMAKLPIAGGSNEAPAEEPAANSSPAAICKHVLAVLGRPTDFLRITVRHVTSDGYRVNVLSGPDLSAARISHSYFVTTDESGTVTQSSPKIVKHY